MSKVRPPGNVEGVLNVSVIVEVKPECLYALSNAPSILNKRATFTVRPFGELLGEEKLSLTVEEKPL